MDFAQCLSSICPKWIREAILCRGELELHVNSEYVCQLIDVLQNHMGTRYGVLINLSGVDYPAKKAKSAEQRFEVVYHLLSLTYNHRVRIHTRVDEITPVPSVCALYPSANWYEREIWDMFGVSFSNHPDLRRILTDYGFEGHPLRKDFPLTGFSELRYDDSEKRVVYEALELAQESRSKNI